MAQAARQYYGYTRYAASAVQADAPERASRPDVRVIPGKRASNPALQSISPEYAFAFKIGMVAPVDVKYLKIVVPGKVVMNPDGSISLAGTLQNVEDYSALMTG